MHCRLTRALDFMSHSVSLQQLLLVGGLLWPSNFQRTGCPVTWKTWKCQGISMQGEKVREFFEKQEKSGKSQGILLCKIHFQPI